MNIIALYDGKIGHENQTKGLLKELKKIRNITVFEIKSNVKSKFYLSFLRFLINYLNVKSLKFISFFYTNFELPTSNIDFIISSGKETIPLNVALSHYFKSKNIFIGSSRNFNHEMFYKILSVTNLGFENNIVLDVPFSLVEIDNSKTKNDIFCLLVGGDGSGYKYDEIDFLHLINLITTLAKSKNIKWVITTSRRTPKLLEEALEGLDKEYIEELVIFNKEPKKCLSEFLSIATKIFVTEDSASMIGDAISSKKEVFTLKPETILQNSDYLSLLDKYEQKWFLKRVCLSEFNLDSFQFENCNKNLNVENILKELF
ncbi:MAG: mitochondrial fission ELM1 family protein [Campylobacterales bacterium]|nr:mitochondrial fission ELM1 family protein [Campylobacterales bacterium]